MLTLSELRERWNARREAYLESGAAVDGVKLADLVLAELDALDATMHAESVTLKEASLIGGYSADHLQRLVASGQLENVGRKGKPRLRRCDVPRKPGHALREPAARNEVADRRRIVASVATRITEAS